MNTPSAVQTLRVHAVVPSPRRRAGHDVARGCSLRCCPDAGGALTADPSQRRGSGARPGPRGRASRPRCAGAAGTPGRLSGREDPPSREAAARRLRAGLRASFRGGRSRAMTTLNQAAKTLNQKRGLEIALTSERLTRDRVEKLERRADAADKEADLQRRALMGFVTRGFWGRFHWLVRGK